MSLIELDETDHLQIRGLLVGRRIVAADMGQVPIPWGDDDEYHWHRNAEGVLTLDDGTRIYVRGHEGGCACSAGDYELTHLASVDNVITEVRFDDNPGNDDYNRDTDEYGTYGWYKIFVVADATEINIATFEGSDGNGYYGTGYELYVQRAEAAQ